jgi:hypothetical protein
MLARLSNLKSQAQPSLQALRKQVAMPQSP